VKCQAFRCIGLTVLDSKPCLRTGLFFMRKLIGKSLGDIGRKNFLFYSFFVDTMANDGNIILRNVRYLKDG